MILMFLCAIKIKEKPEEVKVNTKSFKQTLKEFFKLKEFRNICAYYLLSMVGFDIIMSIFMFFIGDSLGFNELGGGIYTMIFIAIPLVVAILSSSIWVKLSEKYSKHKVYMIAVIFMCIFLLGVLFVPRQSVVGTAILVSCVGFCMSAIQIIPFASLPDVVEVDQATYGERREGVFYGISQFLYKLASGVSIALVSAVLGLFGYIESTGGEIIEQPDSALLAIRIVLAFLPSIMFIVSVFFAYRAKLGREQFNNYKEKIE
jgi:Na+/melibiose symporter-like transporter